jgi:hypothetical protein
MVLIFCKYYLSKNRSKKIVGIKLLTSTDVSLLFIIYTAEIQCFIYKNCLHKVNLSTNKIVINLSSQQAKDN